MKLRIHFSFFGVVLSLYGSGASAQVLPDAGSMLRQIEGRNEPQERALRRIPESPTGPAAATQGPTVVLRRIRFEGNTVLSEQELQSIVASWIGPALEFGELQRLERVIASAYRKAGYLARAEFGPQDLTDGVALMRITEARFGRTRIEGEPLQRISAEQLEQRVAAAQPPGELLRTEAMDRALLLADDLTGVIVNGQLVAGSKRGETDLVLSTKNEPLVTGKVLTDNYGARSTGDARLYGEVALLSPLSRGDRASLALIHNKGSDYINGSFTMPVGAKGWQAGVTATYLNYKLVGSGFEPLDAKGSSNSIELQTSYPMVRTPTANLYGGLTVASKNFNNEVLGITTSDYHIRSGTLGLWGNMLDRQGGAMNDGGSNSFYLALSHGNLDLSHSPNQFADQVNAQAAGRFEVLRWQLARQQPLGESGLNLSLRYGGQISNKNLDSSEKMYLGGATGVRAYPISEAGGSAGQLATVELQSKVHQYARLSAFVDWGRVTNRGNVSSAYDLSGVGLALNLVGIPGVEAQLAWAHRLGNNPNALPNGNDQDGSLKRNRFWLSAGFSF